MRIEELVNEVERLETECDVKDAQKSEIETRMNQLNAEYEQVIFADCSTQNKLIFKIKSPYSRLFISD